MQSGTGDGTDTAVRFIWHAGEHDVVVCSVIAPGFIGYVLETCRRTVIFKPAMVSCPLAPPMIRASMRAVLPSRITASYVRGVRCLARRTDAAPESGVSLGSLTHGKIFLAPSQRRPYVRPRPFWQASKTLRVICSTTGSVGNTGGSRLRVAVQSIDGTRPKTQSVVGALNSIPLPGSS